MSSSVLMTLLRRGGARTALAARSCARAPLPVGGARAVGAVRRASGSVRPDVDRSLRPLTWDSLGIWDDRREEPVLLPASDRHAAAPEVSLSRVGGASVQGLRPQNEDRLRVARLHDELLYFAVFDGHGGAHAADYCYTFMEKHIRDALEDEDDLEQVLTSAFLALDKALRTHLSYFNNDAVLTAGTTATVALLRGGAELALGSVGDSRALLCRDGRASTLTHDHTPERSDERRRVEQCGGVVAWDSVGQATVNGRLAMTRSIGDFHLRDAGVISEPETARLTVQHGRDSFLALTTDGINFLLSDQEVCDLISRCQDPTEAAHLIAEQALQYGSEDNASVLIVPLGAWGRAQRSEVVYSLSRNFCCAGRWN